MTLRSLRVLLACVALGSPACAQPAAPAAPALPGTGNAIFLHPDGASLAHWDALRLWRHGPDGQTHWDRLPAVGLYRGHLLDSLAGTSNGGGTVHAYGVKARAGAVGGDQGAPLTAASGARVSVLREALDAGLAGGIVNTASVTDAGTAVFLATVARRDQHGDIAAQMLGARPHVLLGGGERWFLPAGVMGRHGPGARDDGRDLLAEARQAGYTVVFTREELLALPGDTRRVLGLFASADTFNGDDEATLRAAGQPTYLPGVPTYAEMIRAALDVLGRAGTRFLLVAEEEGTDNYGNVNHAAATLEALARADEGIGVALEFLKTRPDTLIVTAADSNAGGLQVLAATAAAWPHDRPAPARDANGAPIDGAEGEASLPFLAAPDARGERMAFAVAWATRADAAGGILARAAGLNSALVAGSVDNTRVYDVIYRTIFGREPATTARR